MLTSLHKSRRMTNWSNDIIIINTSNNNNNTTITFLLALYFI